MSNTTENLNLPLGATGPVETGISLQRGFALIDAAVAALQDQVTALEAAPAVPAFTVADEGKVMKVVVTEGVASLEWAADQTAA